MSDEWDKQGFDIRLERLEDEIDRLKGENTIEYDQLTAEIERLRAELSQERGASEAGMSDDLVTRLMRVFSSDGLSWVVRFSAQEGAVEIERLRDRCARIERELEAMTRCFGDAASSAEVMEAALAEARDALEEAYGELYDGSAPDLERSRVLELVKAALARIGGEK